MNDLLKILGYRYNVFIGISALREPTIIISRAHSYLTQIAISIERKDANWVNRTWTTIWDFDITFVVGK